MADYSARPPSLLWVFLGLDGRIGREVFILGFVLLNVLGILLLHPAVDDSGFMHFDNVGVVPLFALASSWAVIALAVKRLHDAGLSGWLAILVFVPLFGALGLAIVPSTRGPNPWGAATNMRGTL